MKEEERQARWQAVQKANQHPLNQAAAKALAKIPGYGSQVSDYLHMLSLLLWALDGPLVKEGLKSTLREDLEHLVLKLASVRTPQTAMHFLTHTVDDEEVDLLEEAADPTDPMSLAWVAVDHLKMFLV